MVYDSLKDEGSGDTSNSYKKTKHKKNKINNN